MATTDVEDTFMDTNVLVRSAVLSAPLHAGGQTMNLTVQAVYEDGILKPRERLPLQEHEQVTVTIESLTSVARQTAGMVPWTGDVETLERLVRDPEFGIMESP